jgi:hypothetical protein
VLRDDSEAAELLEKVVAKVSRHLNRHHVPLNPPGIAGLLIFSFRRELRRRAVRQSRLEFIGDGNQLAELLRAPDWVDEINRHLDVEKFMSYVSEEGCTMLRLRRQNYDWNDIAGLLGISISTAKVRLLRELRRAYIKMMTVPRTLDQSGPKTDKFHDT